LAPKDVSGQLLYSSEGALGIHQMGFLGPRAVLDVVLEVEKNSISSKKLNLGCAATLLSD
jgi:hypothetical protein